jgi:hypothetical protein
MLGIVVIGEELDAVFGASADKIMRYMCMNDLESSSLSFYVVFQDYFEF